LNLPYRRVRTIRQIRAKTLVEPRIEHADFRAADSEVFDSVIARPLERTSETGS
jgi:hypothetical protein